MFKSDDFPLCLCCRNIQHSFRVEKKFIFIIMNRPGPALKGVSFEITSTVPLIILGGLISGWRKGVPLYNIIFYSHARSAGTGLPTRDETSEIKLYFITKSLKEVFTRNKRQMFDWIRYQPIPPFHFLRKFPLNRPLWDYF